MILQAWPAKKQTAREPLAPAPPPEFPLEKPPMASPQTEYTNTASRFNLREREKTLAAVVWETPRVRWNA